jgi:WD40 repeat protein
MSAHVLSRDKSQFFGQLLGRVFEGNHWLREAIEPHAQAVREPWLRPMRPTLMAPGGALLRTLEGHAGDVTSVAITPDGRRAVSGSRDKTLRIWDLRSGKTLRALEGHVAQVLDVVLTSDGKRAVSAGYDNTLRIWDLERGEVLRTLEGHADVITNVAVTPDGKRAVSAAYDHTLRIWDVERGEVLHILQCLGEERYSVAITPDGQRAVSASNDKALKIWEIESGKLLSTFAGDTVLAITSDGQRLICGDGRTLLIGRLDSGDVLQTIDDYGGRPVALSRDDKVLVAAGRYDHSLVVWDLDTGKELRRLRGHSSHVLAVALTPDGRQALSASRDGTLKLWDLAGVERAVSNEGHEGVMAIAITPDGQRAVSAGWDWTLKVWDIEGGRSLRNLEGHEGGVNAVAITPDGRRAVSASSDRTLKVWDLDGGQVLRTLEGHLEDVIAVALTPDGQCAVSASSDHTLKIWNLEQGEVLRTLEGHTNSVDGVVITLDGRKAVSASKDHTMKVWDLTSGEMLRSDEISLPYWTWVPRSVMALTPHGDLLAIGREKRLYYWDLERGEAVGYFDAHTDLLTAVAFTPGGERAVSASNDRTVAIWDFFGEKVLATFVFDSAVRAATIACEGRVVVACDHGGYMHFLRLENPPARGP